MKISIITFLSVFVTYLNCSAQDGSIDSTFGINGFSTTAIVGSQLSGQALDVQPDGKIVVVGSIKNGAQLNMLITRYLKTGIIDSSFGINGFVTVDYNGYDDEASVVKVIDQGKILIAGYTKDATNIFFALLRLTPTGQLDSSFGINGKTLTSTNDKIIALVTQSTGKIVVTGSTTMARYSYQGSIDGSFGTGGFTAVTSAKGLCILNDDKIILTSGSGALTKRYSSGGILDTTFGNGGGKYENFDSSLCNSNKIRAQYTSQCMSIGSNQNILIASDVTTSCLSSVSYFIRINKLRDVGQIDTSFKEWSKGIPFTKKPVGIIEQANKSVLLLWTIESNGTKICLDRILPSGISDSTFSKFNLMGETQSVLSGVKAILANDSTLLILVSYTQSQAKGILSYFRLFKYISSLKPNKPQIDFTADKISNDTLKSLTFTDKTINALSRVWSFSPGNIVYTTGNYTSISPKVRFTKPGNYTVKLTCTNQYGIDSLVKNNYIFIGIPPKPLFGVSRTLADTNTIIQLTDTSLNSPVSRLWTITPNTFEYGGGTDSTSNSPIIRFKVTGLYSVKLKTTNMFGTDSLVKSNYITISNPFTLLDFEASQNKGDTSAIFIFSNKSTSTTTINYVWSFTPNTVQYVNGTSASSKNPIVRFILPGNYSATLKANWSAGNDSLTKTNFITIGMAPQAFIKTDSTIVSSSPAVIHFSDSSTNAPVYWKWVFSPSTVTFVNGTSQFSQNPVVHFTATGKYTVKLVVTNDYGTDSTENIDFISVGNKPAPAFTSNIFTGDTSTLFNFIDLSTNNPTNRFWSFYPNTVSYKIGNDESVNPVIQFNDTGTYTVKLRVCNILGCDSIAKTAFILIGTKPTTAFGVNQTSGDTSFVYQFTDSSLNKPDYWEWLFSPTSISYLNGNSHSQNPQIKCNVIGVYSVKLITCNAFGCDTLEKTNLINTLSSGLPSISEDKNILKIFPIPANESLMVLMTNGENIEQIEIRDISGRPIYQAPNIHSSQHKVILKKNNLSGGVYFIFVSTEKGINTRKIIIQTE
jgi:uncharacterized delta-60 repeat protein